MRSVWQAIAPIVALLVVVQLTAAEAPQNDAGLLTDAGNTRATASPLPGPGTYTGELRSHDDDWYTTLRAPSPRCIQLDVTGDTYSDATLAIKTGGSTYSITAPISLGNTTRLALAGSQVDRTWEGLVRKPNPAGNDAARPRSYTFTLSDAGTPVGDGGLSGDAGAALSTARALEAGCSGGRLQPFHGLGDAADAYRFTLNRTSQIVYSLGSTAPVSLALVDGNDLPLAPPIGADQVASIELPAGTYYFRASAVGGSEVIDYVLAFLGTDRPPGNPCRPTCYLGS